MASTVIGNETVDGGALVKAAAHSDCSTIAGDDAIFQRRRCRPAAPTRLIVCQHTIDQRHAVSSAAKTSSRIACQQTVGYHVAA